MDSGGGLRQWLDGYRDDREHIIDITENYPINASAERREERKKPSRRGDRMTGFQVWPSYEFRRQRLNCDIPKACTRYSLVSVTKCIRFRCTCRKKSALRTELYAQYVDPILHISIHEGMRSIRSIQIFEPVFDSFMYVLPSRLDPTAILSRRARILNTMCWRVVRERVTPSGLQRGRLRILFGRKHIFIGTQDGWE